MVLCAIPSVFVAVAKKVSATSFQWIYNYPIGTVVLGMSVMPYTALQ